jgi:hypothetical protein
MISSDWRTVDSGEKLPRVYGSCPGPANEGDLGIAGHGNPRQFRRRVGIGKAAADGAAIADLGMRNMGDRLAQQRVHDRQPRVVLDIAPTDARAETNAGFVDADGAEPRNPTQIDEHARRRQPEGKHGHQTLPPGDHDRFAVQHEQIDRLHERDGGSVLEGCWLQLLCLAKARTRAKVIQ